jgi:transposase
VARNSCRLEEKGKEVRNILLDLVYGKTYNDSQLSKDINLSRDTIRKILDKDKGGIQLGKLTTFFKKLLEQISEEDVQNHLDAYELKRFYNQIGVQEDITSFLPRHLYKHVANISPVVSSDLKHLRSNNINNKILDDLIQLFWQLDYKQQEAQFETALESSDRCLAFSIVAPCNTTQKWLLNRLLRQVVAPDHNIFLTINLHKSGVRNDFQGFLQHLSQHFGTTIDLDLIFNEIDRVDNNSSIIIIINQFRQFKYIQKSIITEFWEPLCEKISKRRRTGRVIMFWVDECHVYHDCNNITKLHELTEISQLDIEKWMNKYSCNRVYKTCVFPDNLLNSNFSNGLWDWHDPWLILDSICREFKLENGITDIESLWKWKL